MARSGLYVKLDTNFPDDDKIEAVGLEGAGLYAMALCVAKRVMTDGRLTRAKVRKLGGSDDLIDRLVAVGLFTSDPASNDVWITAWLAHNDEAAAIEQRRSEDAARKRVSRAKRPAGHADTGPERPSGHADLEEKRREEKENPPTRSGGSGAFEAEFDRVWKHYPRKIERKAALRQYQARRRSGASMAELMAATKHYADAVLGLDQSFVKHGSSFYGRDDPWRDYVSGPPASATTAATPRFSAPLP